MSNNKNKHSFCDQCGRLKDFSLTQIFKKMDRAMIERDRAIVQRDALQARVSGLLTANQTLGSCVVALTNERDAAIARSAEISNKYVEAIARAEKSELLCAATTKKIIKDSDDAQAEVVRLRSELKDAAHG